MDFKLSIQTLSGRTEVPFSMATYQAAEDAKMSLSQYINHTYPTDSEKYGTAFEQCCAISGLVLSDDPHSPKSRSSLEDIFTGKAVINSAIVRPDGTDRFTPAGRFFYPAILIDMLEASLRDNRDSYNSAFMEMVAFTRSITSPRYDQVIVDYSRPQGARSQPISQLAEPVRMLSVTTASVTRSIPTWAIGIEISQEAMQAATLDLIAIALREHSNEERSARLNEDFLAIVNGDADAGEPGILSGAPEAQDFDSTISAAGVITQKAWVKYLMQYWMRRRITHVVTNIDTYLAIEARSGRPVKDGEPAVDERLNTIPEISLPLIPGRVKVFPMENFPTNLIVGLDASKAMRRIVQVSASYQAIEQFVMRKSMAMRVDTSERIESAGYPQAFAPLLLTV